MTEGQRRASWSEPYYQVLLHIDAEKQLAIMTKKFNMAKQGRDKFRKENQKLKTANRNSLLKAVLTLAPLKEQNAKLKEENEELKKGLIEEHDRAERCKDRLIDLADISKGLQKDVKKLQKEIQELEQQISDITDALWDEAVPVPRTDLILSDIHKGRQAIEENQELFQELENMKKKYICIPGEYLMDN